MTENDFIKTHSYLVKEWNDARNISEFSPGSNYNAQWKCEKGHEWKAKISYRINGYGSCPACQSFAFHYPHLLEEWDYEKNTLNPWEVRIGSGKKAWWIGSQCKHSWQMEVRSRIRHKYNCPYCSSQKVLIGFNDLATTHPHLAKQWDDTKNKKLATEITYGSKTKAWWKDNNCGHSWQMSPLHRTKIKDYSCIVCRSVGIKNPELLEEWNDTKDPFNVYAGSGDIVNWKCKRNPLHLWTMEVWSRTKKTRPQNCPYCAGRRVLIGESDFSSMHPHLKEEWDDLENIEKYSSGSNYKAQWKCKENNQHIWKATINSRTARKWHCPHCGNKVSRQEQEIYEYIKNYIGKESIIIQSDRSLISPYELDIYIPENKIAIEFNGLYWHSEKTGKDKYYHYNKWKACKDKGIQLLTIWEDDWIDKPELIKKMIAHKLGFSTQNKIAARKTEIIVVNKQQAKEFYDSNHIQGHKDGLHIALKDKKTHEIVAISTWKKIISKKEIHLERFATSHIVPGGFSKLLKYAINIFKNENFDKIITFADHQVSNGALYVNNGFIENTELAPDYMYFYKNQKHHKFGFRLKRFRNDPQLQYIEGYTEKQLAELNGLHKIWDSGKTKYTLELNFMND